MVVMVVYVREWAGKCRPRECRLVVVEACWVRAWQAGASPQEVPNTEYKVIPR